MELTQEIFNKAVNFAINRGETRGDKQARSAEIDRSYVKDGKVVLVNKPLSGWRFSEVVLTTVLVSDISA